MLFFLFAGDENLKRSCRSIVIGMRSYPILEDPRSSAPLTSPPPFPSLPLFYVSFSPSTPFICLAFCIFLFFQTAKIEILWRKFVLGFLSFRRENPWVYFVAILSDSFFLLRAKPESWPQTCRISDTVLGLFYWPRWGWGWLGTIGRKGVSITDSEPLFVRTCVPQILFTRWVEEIDFCHRSTWSFLILKLRVVKLLEFGSVESTRYSLSHYLHDRHNGFIEYSPGIKATVINKSSKSYCFVVIMPVTRCACCRWSLFYYALCYLLPKLQVVCGIPSG